MTIALYGRGLTNRAGIGRYSRQLLRTMVDQPRDHDFRLIASPLVPRDSLSGVNHVHLARGGNRVLEEQVHLPKALRQLRPDVFHNPDFTLPFRIPGDVRAVITVHDVAYTRLPKSNSVKSKVLLGMLVPWSVRRANAIVTVSEFSKSEIVDVYKVHPSKIYVIPNAVDPSFRPATNTEVAHIQQRFSLPTSNLVLYLGGIEERKNLLRLALAVKGIQGARLAIAGTRNRRGTQIMDRCSEILGDRLLELGFVADEDLPALYSAATVFAYPSLYEGFGIPPLEAMACGTPVAVANATSLPEAVGEAASMFDPMDTDAMASAIGVLLDGPTRERAIQRGFDHVRKFTWESVASRTMDLYESLR